MLHSELITLSECQMHQRHCFQYILCRVRHHSSCHLEACNKRLGILPCCESVLNYHRIPRLAENPGTGGINGCSSPHVSSNRYIIQNAIGSLYGSSDSSCNRKQRSWSAPIQVLCTAQAEECLITCKVWPHARYGECLPSKTRHCLKECRHSIGAELERYDVVAQSKHTSISLLPPMFYRYR